MVRFLGRDCLVRRMKQKLTTRQRHRIQGMKAAKAVLDKWYVDLVAAGDQFDQGGDIYRKAWWAKEFANDIQKLIYLEGSAE
jgi:hypothetical protein